MVKFTEEMLIHLKQRPPKMTKEDFIEHIKKNHKFYISYCEIIIDENGDIYEARPSHQQFLVNYGMEKDNISNETDFFNTIELTSNVLNEMLRRYNMVSIWYEFGLIPRALVSNKEIQNTLQFLKDNKLLHKEFKLGIV